MKRWRRSEVEAIHFLCSGEETKGKLPLPRSTYIRVYRTQPGNVCLFVSVPRPLSYMQCLYGEPKALSARRENNIPGSPLPPLTQQMPISSLLPYSVLSTRSEKSWNGSIFLSSFIVTTDVIFFFRAQGDNNRRGCQQKLSLWWSPPPQDLGRRWTFVGSSLSSSTFSSSDPISSLFPAARRQKKGTCPWLASASIVSSACCT